MRTHSPAGSGGIELSGLLVLFLALVVLSPALYQPADATRSGADRAQL